MTKATEKAIKDKIKELNAKTESKGLSSTELMEAQLLHSYLLMEALNESRAQLRK